MFAKGAGARIAWSIESKRVLKDLEELFGGHPIELTSFEEGEARRQAVLSSYRAAQGGGALRICQFADRAAFTDAIGRELDRWHKAEHLSVFLQDSERKGVYKTTRAALEDCSARLLVYDGNGVFFASMDDEHGVLLDIEHQTGAPAVFELHSW